MYVKLIKYNNIFTFIIVHSAALILDILFIQYKLWTW